MRGLLMVTATALFLSMSSALFAAGDSAPVKVWTEPGPGTPRGSAYNVYYGGGVFDGQFYTGQLSYGPLAYAATQTGTTALVHSYDSGPTDFNGARSVVAIGDYIFYNRNVKPSGSTSPRLNRLNSDWTNDVPFDLGANGGDVAPEGMATDGTSLFMSPYTVKNSIRKYSISNQAASFTLTKTLDVVIAGASTFRGLSYCNGSIYAVDNGTAAGKGIYEINASTGAYTQIGSHAATKGYQAVRYADKLFVVGQDGKLVVYNIANGALDAGTVYDLGLIELYGIGVVGTGTHVTGFWVTSPSGLVSYFSFTMCNHPFADADGDRDVDQKDFGIFQMCFGGAGGTDGAGLGYPCTCFDTDNNTSVEKADFSAFEKCVTGPAIPWVATNDCP
jgi:hypothetical protein